MQFAESVSLFHINKYIYIFIRLRERRLHKPALVIAALPIPAAVPLSLKLSFPLPLSSLFPQLHLRVSGSPADAFFMVSNV